MLQWKPSSILTIPLCSQNNFRSCLAIVAGRDVFIVLQTGLARAHVVQVLRLHCSLLALLHCCKRDKTVT